MKKKLEHIRLVPDSSSKKAGALLWCIECSEAYRVTLPITVELLAGVLETWVDIHQNCFDPEIPKERH